MRYVLLMNTDETVEYGPEQVEALPEFQRWLEYIESRGVRHSGTLLRPRSDATTVQRRGDEVLVTDGPFAETKDQIGGFEIIECSDLDEAIEVASRHPSASFGRIEVRPIWEK